MNRKMIDLICSIWTVWVISSIFRHVSCLPSASIDLASMAATSGGFQTTNSIESKQDFLENIYEDCANEKGSAPCFKYKLFAFVDKIASRDAINLTNGITVVKTAATHNAAAIDGSPRSVETNGDDQPNKVPSGDNSDLMTGIVSRLDKFFKTHTLKVDLRNIDVFNVVSRAGRTFDELSESLGGDTVEMARKKKKGGKILLPLLMMLKMKLFSLIPIAFGFLALLAGKALIIGKIALLLSVIIALKKLLSHQKTVTYEIVSHPHHATSHVESSYSPASDYSGGSSSSYGGSSHGGWGRSADSHEMAYSAQKPHQS